MLTSVTAINTIVMVVLVGFQITAGSGQGQQMRAKIAATSPEGLAVIEKAKRKAPEKQSSQSAKTLGDAVEDSVNGRGRPRIEPIGWAAFPNPQGRWTISFYFKDAEKSTRRQLGSTTPKPACCFLPNSRTQ